MRVLARSVGNGVRSGFDGRIPAVDQLRHHVGIVLRMLVKAEFADFRLLGSLHDRTRNVKAHEFRRDGLGEIAVVNGQEVFRFAVHDRPVVIFARIADLYAESVRISVFPGVAGAVCHDVEIGVIAGRTVVPKGKALEGNGFVEFEFQPGISSLAGFRPPAHAPEGIGDVIAAHRRRRGKALQFVGGGDFFISRGEVDVRRRVIGFGKNVIADAADRLRLYARHLFGVVTPVPEIVHANVDGLPPGAAAEHRADIAVADQRRVGNTPVGVINVSIASEILSSLRVVARAVFVEFVAQTCLPSEIHFGYVFLRIRPQIGILKTTDAKDQSGGFQQKARDFFLFHAIPLSKFIFGRRSVSSAEAEGRARQNRQACTFREGISPETMFQIFVS